MKQTRNAIEIINLTKSFSDVMVFDNLNLAIQENRFTCILGPNGCGKTTFILMIADLLKPDSGKILINGEKNSKATDKLGVIFQEYNRSLFPWLSVEKNIGFGLEIRNVKNAEEIVKKWIKIMGLNGLENYRPSQLSAGMKQRVAFARALAYDPLILLIDEPFSSSDYTTKMNFYDKFLKILDENKKTVLFVTHDIDEAIYLSDRIIVLSKKPVKIRKIIDNKLPKPRNKKMRKSNYFQNLKKEIEKVL